MKKFCSGLAAAILITALSNVAYAGPTELIVGSTNAKREIIRDITFTVELYQEGNPTPLYQTDTSKSGCTAMNANTALTCKMVAVLDLPSKFTPVSGIQAYKVVFKSHRVGEPVQVSQDIIINHDSTSTAAVIVEPFRSLELHHRIFETAVNKRFFVLYPKSFTSTVIRSDVVKAALAETYQTLKSVRKVDEYTAFLNLLALWQDYLSITDAELLAVLASDVRFADPANERAAYQALEDAGLNLNPIPVPLGLGS